MLSESARPWTPVLLSSIAAVALAGIGLPLSAYAPGLVPPLAMTGLLVGSLAATASAFTLIALRVRRLEMENMGLVEELSQEFDRVKDKLEIFQEALAEPHSLEVAEEQDVPLRRVMVK